MAMARFVESEELGGLCSRGVFRCYWGCGGLGRWFKLFVVDVDFVRVGIGVRWCGCVLVVGNCDLVGVDRCASSLGLRFRFIIGMVHEGGELYVVVSSKPVVWAKLLQNVEERRCTELILFQLLLGESFIATYIAFEEGFTLEQLLCITVMSDSGGPVMGHDRSWLLAGKLTSERATVCLLPSSPGRYRTCGCDRHCGGWNR